MTNNWIKLKLVFQKIRMLWITFLNRQKYGWLCLVFSVETMNEPKNVFRKLDHITLAEMKEQAWGYFGSEVIVNVT